MTNNLLGNIGIIMINPHITGWKDQSSETIHPSIGSNFCKLIRLTGKPQYLCSTTRQFLSRCESAAIRSMALGSVVLYLFFVWWFKVVPSGVFWEMLSRTIHLVREHGHHGLKPDIDTETLSDHLNPLPFNSLYQHVFMP